MARVWLSMLLGSLLFGCSLSSPDSPAVSKIVTTPEEPITNTKNGTVGSGPATNRSAPITLDPTIPDVQFKTLPQQAKGQLLASRVIWSHAATESKIYIGTSGGLCISGDKAKTFTTLTVANGLLSNFITHVEAYDKRVLIYTAQGFMISEDEGKTWSVLEIPITTTIEHIALFKNEIFILSDGILYSTSDLKSFSTTKIGIKSYSQIFATESVLIIDGEKYLLSKDRGKTFKETVISVKNTGFIYEGNGRLYKESTDGTLESVDQGVTFSPVLNSAPFDAKSFFVGKTVLAKNSKNLYQKISASADWTLIKEFPIDLAGHTPVGSSKMTVFESGGSVFAFGADPTTSSNSLFRIDPNGEWINISSENEIGSVPIFQIFGSSSKIYLKADKDLLYESNDSGLNFKLLPSTSAFFKTPSKLWTVEDLKTEVETAINAIHSDGENSCYATEDGLYILKDDSQKHFTKIHGLAHDNIRACFIKGSRVVAVTVAGISVRDDSGGAFSTFTKDSGTAITFFQNKFYVGTNRGFLVSDDLKEWTRVTLSSSTEGNSITSFSSSDKLIVAGTSAGVYLSSDGKRWTLRNLKNSGLEGDNVKSVHVDGTNLYVGTASGFSAFVK